LKSRSACSKARTAATAPGEGGFFGGAGNGLGVSALRLATKAFRDGGLDGRFFGANFAGAFMGAGRFAAAAFLLLGRTAIRVFFLGAALLIARLPAFLAVAACLLFFAGGSFFPTAAFFAFGAAVILPGRLGFLEGAFLPFVARIF